MKRQLKKFLALILSMSMLFGIMPVSAHAAYDYAHNEAESSDDYYDIISKSDWDIAPGIKETEIVLNNDAGDRRQVIHLMEADISNQYTRVISSYTKMDTSNYAISTIPEHAAYIEDVWGENVVGAMNTCLSWYNSAAYAEDPSRVNEPLGFMMVDGEVYFDHSVGFPTCIVIHKDTNDAGETRPTDIPKVEMRTVTDSSCLNGWEDQVIPCSSGYIVKDGVNQQKASHDSNTAARSVVGVKADGSIVIMMNDGRQSPYSLGMNMYECAEVMIAAGCVYAANCDGGGSSTFMSQRPGEALEVNCSPCDGALRQNTHGIMFISTAPATGEFDNAYLQTENDYYVPYSTVEVDAIGRDFSGAEATIPTDVVWSLNDKSFGTVENGVFESNGKLGDVEINMNFNGEIVGSKTIHIVNPESVSFEQESTVIPYGKSTSLDIVATYGAFEVSYTEDAFNWMISDSEAGVRDGLKYTVGNDTTKTSVVITAEYKYADLEAASLNISFGKGSEVVWDFEDGDISNWLGIKAVRKWLADNNIKECANLFQGGNFSDDNSSETFLSSVEKGGKVYSGDYALGVELDFTHSSFSGWSYNMFFNVEGQTVLRDVANGKNATRLGMWVYIPEELWEGSDLSGIAAQTQLYGGTSADNVSSFQAHLTLSTSTKRLNALKDEDIPEDRWVYCYIDLTGYDYVSLQNPEKQTWREPCFMRFYTQHYTPKNLIFYFDDITLDYSSAVDDREAPVISNLTVNTAGTNIRSFNATIGDFVASNASGLDYTSAQILVDGVGLENVVASGTTISSKEVSLASGNHTVTFLIKDKMGNTMKKSMDFTVEGTAPVTLGGHNATNSAPEYDSVYYVDINVADIASVEKVSTTIKLSTAHTWEADYMDLVEGITAEYSFNYYDNTVTVTLTKTEECTLTGEQTLASIPVRVWSWDEDESGVTEEKIFADGLGPIVSIDVKTVMGSVTYAKGYYEDYTGTFNSELLVSTNINDVNNLWHDHVAGEAQNKEATCDEVGYIGRTYCVGCNCLKYKVDGTCTHNVDGCGSVIDWGVTKEALGHDWKVNAEGKLACANGGELFNGVYTDGKTYIDGSIVENGWFEIEGVKTYYYANGMRLVGSHLIDGVLCTFDESGIYDAEFKYDGFYEIDDTVMYFIANKYQTGCQKINGEFYYFDSEGKGFDGEVELCNVKCLFENGQFVETDTVKNAGLYGNNIEFVLTKDGKLTVGGSGDMPKAARVGSMPWYEANRFDVKSITIGKDITSINNVAFYNLYYLSYVEFEEGSKLETINASAFGLAPQLKEIVLPDGLITLNASVFYQCENLVKVVLPYSVASIASNAFEKCEKVELYVADNSYAMKYAVENGIPFQGRRVAISNGLSAEVEWTLYTDGELVLSGSGAMEDYSSGEAPWWNQRAKIKKVVVGKDITYIGKFSFAKCNNLTDISYEEGSAVETIGWGAFGYCTALTTVTIPATVKKLDGYAFYECTALKTVTMSEKDSLESIGMYAFWNDTALENVFIPDAVSEIGEGAFYNAGEVLVSVQDGSYAHEYAMSNKLNLTARPAPARVIASGECGDAAGWEFWSDGVLKITGSGAMADYSVKGTPWEKYRMRIATVEIGKDITYIGKFSFMMCNNLTDISYEEGSAVETIGWGAFGCCTALTTVTIPATVKKLDGYAIYECTALSTVVFEKESSLEEIGMYAFWNDTALTEIIDMPTNITFGEGAFYNSGYTVE